MFGMNPVTLYAIAFLIFTNLAAGVGWWTASMRADHEQQRAVVAEQKLNLFAEQVRVQGEKAERRTAELIANAKTISMKKDADYAKNLDRLRADYQRMRKQYAAGSGGGAVPSISEGPRSVAEIPTDCLPLAEQSAETTLMLVTLQEWVTEQSSNLTETQITNDTNSVRQADEANER